MERTNMKIISNVLSFAIEQCCLWLGHSDINLHRYQNIHSLEELLAKG